MSDVVERMLAALNARDIDAFVACYAADATIEDGHDVVLARGRDELRARYGPILAEVSSLQVEALSRVVVGEFVVQEERVHGREPEGERHIAIYLVRAGAIVRERLLR